MPRKIDYAHMIAAGIYAEQSYAKRLKVGAIIVKDDRVISIGYNGTPSGWSNECEEIEFIDDSEDLDYAVMVAQGYTFGAVSTTAGWVKRVTKPEVIHAEANAVAKLARSSESGENAVMYVTHSPCFECAKLIYTAGIKKVFYRDQYRSDDGIEFLKKCNVEVEELCLAETENE
jgi:dCMP deaminase